MAKRNSIESTEQNRFSLLLRNKLKKKRRNSRIKTRNVSRLFKTFSPSSCSKNNLKQEKICDDFNLQRRIDRIDQIKQSMLINMNKMIERDACLKNLEFKADDLNQKTIDLNTTTACCAVKLNKSNNNRKRMLKRKCFIIFSLSFMILIILVMSFYFYEIRKVK
jgi:hypothetical protein